MILILLLPLVLLYFLPAIVALTRGRQVGVVLVVNLFFGWTLLGWVGALAIAVSTPPQPPVLIQPLGYPPYQFQPYRPPNLSDQQLPYPPYPPHPPFPVSPPR